MADREDLQRYAGECGGTLGNEWLYDFTCLEYDSGRWLKGVPLVAECELANQDRINDDSWKLLLARADVRLMIFNGNYYREGRESIPSKGLEDFRRYIRECTHTRTGDTYLFAARLHDGENGTSVRHRFDYHVFVA